MNDITNELFAYQDKKFALFQTKLIPTILPETIIGVKVPTLRKIAHKYFKTPLYNDFMSCLPHRYYDENMLHAIFVSQIDDYTECIAELERFLPFVDNWAVSDTILPKTFKYNKTNLLSHITFWATSKKTYSLRFSIKALMTHFLDEDFSAAYLKIPANIKSDEYYVNMMIAWFFAEALVKQWDSTIPYLENKCLDKWINNKTIQKARESHRISDSQKKYLQQLRKNVL